MAGFYLVPSAQPTLSPRAALIDHSFLTDEMDGPLAPGILGLTKLPPHLPTFAFSFLGFLFVHQVLAPWGSNYWFREAYKSQSARARNSWYAFRSDLAPKSISNSSYMASGLDVQVQPCCIASPYSDHRAALVTGHLS